MYEALLEHYVLEAGHTVVRQKRFSFEVDGVRFKEALRPDLKEGIKRVVNTYRP